MKQGASVPDRATHEPGLASRPGHSVSVPCADCANGDFPMYGVAPHECFWRKGPEFAIGQSTLVPFGSSDCFVPDLEIGETWTDFRYPGACGVFYCPTCQQEEYRAAWGRLTARIGAPPAEVAHA